MEVSGEIEGGAFVARVGQSRIDAPVALAFKDEMRRVCADAPERVVLDLRQVDFIDSSGLGAIVATMKHLSPDRQLVLAGLTEAVDRVFRLTRMDSVFDIYVEYADALGGGHD